MTETQIKEYLNKYSITTKEGLAKHVEELKRNTKPNIGLISELVYVLEDEENLFSNLFCGKKLTKLVKDRLDLATEYRNNMFLETPLLRTIKRCSNQCFCDNSCKTESVLGDYDKSKTKGNPIKYNFGLTEQLNSVVGDLEGINRPPQRTVSSHFLDEVLEQLNSAEKENEVNLKTEENKGLSTRLKADKQNLVFTEDSEINKETDENGKPLTYWGGKKETDGKTDYSEINLEILDLMSDRFTANKNKYPVGNMKKPIYIKSLEWALFRHVKKMIQPIEGDYETYKEHLAAVMCNASMILDQLKTK